MRSLWNKPTTFWILLSLPAFVILAGGFGPDTYGSILHITGELSARLMIVAMMITPMRIIWPRAGWIVWLLRRRRYLGLAAFGYAVLHVIAYLADKGTFAAVAAEAAAIGIWTGWLAFVIFVPMAMTSNDAAVRMLGRRWKSVQRGVYAAAVLTLAHWIAVTGGLSVLINFTPLIGLETYRILVALFGRPFDVQLKSKP